MIYKEFILHSGDGEKLRADVRFIPNGKKKPVIIFLHGFKGFKDWGPFSMVRERLASAGFISIGFNFSHNGVGDDLQNFTELDRFAENTISLELDELRDVVNEIALLENIPVEASEINVEAIGLLGHSRGGSVAILGASHQKTIRAVAAWAPPEYFHRYSERQKEEWKNRGFMEIQNARTGQTMRLNVSLLDDIEQHAVRFDVMAGASALTSQEKGLLLIAGSEDLTVKPQESRDIFTASVKEFSDLLIIPAAGHTFGAEHPGKDIPPAMEQAIEKTVNFFQNYLVTHPIPFPE